VDGSHVHQQPIGQVGAPALPRQPRHAYAAGFQRGLLTGFAIRLRSRPDPATRTGHALRSSPYPPDWSCHYSYRGFSHWFTRVTPSDLARRDPPRLVVPERPAVVEAASHPTRRSPGPAASSFTEPLRRPGEEVSHLPRLPTPPGVLAPRGAPRSSSTSPTSAADHAAGTPTDSRPGSDRRSHSRSPAARSGPDAPTPTGVSPSTPAGTARPAPTAHRSDRSDTASVRPRPAQRALPPTRHPRSPNITTSSDDELRKPHKPPSQMTDPVI
jgi:hypothetical protein